MVELKMTLTIKKTLFIKYLVKPKTYINVFHILIFIFQTIILIIHTNNKFFYSITAYNYFLFCFLNSYCIVLTHLNHSKQLIILSL